MPGPVLPLPSREYLLACFVYDPLTGVLTWRERPREHFTNAHPSAQAWNAKCAGKTAGVAGTGGYRQIRIDRVTYKAHRIIWKMMTGEEPLKTIDHRRHRRDASDDRWENLRPAT